MIGTSSPTSSSSGPNIAEVLNFPGFSAQSTGRAFAEYLSSASPSSRYEAIMEAGEPDIGRGVSYRVVYGLVDTPQDARARTTPIWIEDNGRWFAGSDGRPAHAHGTIRVVTDRYEAERQARAAIELRSADRRCDPQPFQGSGRKAVGEKRAQSDELRHSARRHR